MYVTISVLFNYFYNHTTMTENTKTLIGNDNYLFLIDDSEKELVIHCNNLDIANYY